MGANMIWNQLLSQDQVVCLPWTGGRVLHGIDRTWKIAGELPPEHGWHRFSVSGSRRASWLGPGDINDSLAERARCITGYLVDDRLISDEASVGTDVKEVFAQGRQTWLVEPGLDRFARATAVQHRGGKLIYLRQEFPLGPEAHVLEAYQDRRDSVDDIAHVTPALHVAFLWYTWRRRFTEAERRRVAQLARMEARRRRIEERNQRIEVEAWQRAQNRQLAYNDFESAAREALAVSGAELLDERPARIRTERIVQFRFRGRRFECVVQAATLRIVDAGVCLEDHMTGERGDTLFTLESLPAVLDEAMQTNRLVVFRHVE